MTSPPVMRAILQSSVASSGRYAGIPESLANSTLTPQDLRLVLIGTPIQALQVATAFVFEKVGEFIQGVPELWTPMYSWEGGNPTWVLSGFDDSSHPKMTLAVAALMSRLGKLWVFMNQLLSFLTDVIRSGSLAGVSSSTTHGLNRSIRGHCYISSTGCRLYWSIDPYGCGSLVYCDRD